MRIGSDKTEVRRLRRLLRDARAVLGLIPRSPATYPPGERDGLAGSALVVAGRIDEALAPRRRRRVR